MSKALRYLRIAFSATCVIVAVLLSVLWVRSYWWADNIYDPTHGALSVHGVLMVGFGHEVPPGRVPKESKWRINTESTKTVARSLIDFSNMGFHIRRDDNEWDLQFPHWLVVILMGALAVVPWLPWIPRRFSLRTLLIAMTLVAVVLGLVVWAGR